MPVLLRTSAGSRPAPAPIHRPPSQVSNDVLRVPASSRRVSQHSVTPSVAVSTHAPPPVRRTVSAVVPPETLKSWLRKAYKRFHLNNLIPLFLIMIYMLIGSIIFYSLESSADTEIAQENHHIYERERELLRRRVDEIMADRSARKSRRTRRKWIDEAVNHYENKVGFQVKNETQWDIMSSMYYAGTLFTTIGYGDMACVTTAGRILTVIYSCVGIPLMLITLNDLGKFLYNNINGCVKSVDSVYLGVIRVCSPRKEAAPEIDLERGNETGEVSSLASQMGSEHTDDDFEFEEKVPRMSVKVALGITVGWIFFCAALFRLWENWSYGESLYFMYISCSTIGLGDIAVERRDMMVLCFVFVIIGLSLVSMSINVVQVALEDFYVNMMLKLIMDYQEKMAAGGDQVGASVGMMRMWGNNKTAKLLMPLLSKEKKKMAMEKVEVEAKSQGIEVPTILTDLDGKTGMPKLFCIEEPKENEEVPVEVEQMVQKQILLEESTFDPIYIAHDAGTQTDTICSADETEQTEERVCEEESTQTEMERRECEGVETQTEGITTSNVEAQTFRVEVADAITVTLAPSLYEQQSQTEVRLTMEEEVQTYLVEQIDAQSGTEFETKNARIQTPCPVIEQKTIQTEDLEERKSPSKMSSARRRWRRAFGKAPKHQNRSLDPSPAMSEWRDVEGSTNEPEVEGEEEQEEEENEDEGSVESLHWDPVDGMHAEKQLPVSRLAKMFERNASVDLKKKPLVGRKTSSFKKQRPGSRTRKSSE